MVANGCLPRSARGRHTLVLADRQSYDRLWYARLGHRRDTRVVRGLSFHGLAAEAAVAG